MLPRESLTAADLRALPPEQVLARCFDRLRWFVALDTARLKAWRTQPDTVRHLLVLSTVETDAGLPANATFPGLAAVFEHGAIACSAVADEAGQAGTDARRLAACDRRLVDASGADGTVARMRSFVREHADDLAAYWAKP